MPHQKNYFIIYKMVILPTFQKVQTQKGKLYRAEIPLFSKELVTNDMNYFSSMLSKMKLWKIIHIASQENTDIAKAEKFLKFLGIPFSGRTICYKSSLRCGLSTSIPNVIKNTA